MGRVQTGHPIKKKAISIMHYETSTENPVQNKQCLLSKLDSVCLFRKPQNSDTDGTLNLDWTLLGKSSQLEGFARWTPVRTGVIIRGPLWQTLSCGKFLSNVLYRGIVTIILDVISPPKQLVSENICIGGVKGTLRYSCA